MIQFTTEPPRHRARSSAVSESDLVGAARSWPIGPRRLTGCDQLWTTSPESCEYIDQAHTHPNNAQRAEQQRQRRHCGWARGRRDARAFFGCRRMAVGQLEPQAFLTLCHRPVMIGREDWLEQERERAQQRLVGADLPIVGDIDPLPILLERPDAAPHEI